MSKRVNAVEIEKKVEKKSKWNIKHLKIRKKKEKQLDWNTLCYILKFHYPSASHSSKTPQNVHRLLDSIISHE